MKKLNVRRGYLIGIAIAGFAAGVVTVSLQRARAAGIPSTGAMTYSGLLQDSAGAPLTGNTHTIEVKLWTSATATTALCDTGSPTAATPLTAGRFSIQLPDACTTAIASNNNALAEVILDGTSLGRMALGAVPYAIEANHAVNADTATAASAGGALATQISALDKRIAALETAASDWQSYTPVFSSNGGVTVPHTSTVGKYRRVGDSAEVMIQTTFQSQPMSGANWWQWSLPPNLTIDSTKVTGIPGGLIGAGMTGQGIGNNIALAVSVRSTTTVSVTANGAGTYYVNDTVPFTWVDGSMQIYFTVPIVGWTSKQ